jgi:EmrB/QacA subfamily drug resistance transporter
MKRLVSLRVAVFVVFIASLFMSIMDSTIVNVALSTMSHDFGVNIAATDVIVVAYLVSLAVTIPAAGWVGDRWGSKRTFLFALGLFSLASALCGLSQTLNQLVAARILQGAGAGILSPVSTALLYRTFLPHERIQVSRISVVPTVIAPATGPLLGGFLVDHFSWHWVFFVNVPIGIATLLFGWMFLQEHREPPLGRFDVAGFLLASIGFSVVMYALTQGSVYGWTSARILGSLLAGALALGALIAVELRTEHPLIQMRLFENRLFRTANVVSLFGAACFLGVLFCMPLLLQQGLGNSALDSGSATFPEALGVLVSSQIVTRLYPRVGPRRLMGFGLLWVAATALLCCTIGPNTSLWVVRLLMFCAGAGMANVFLPFGAAAFATISSADTGRASVISNAQNQLGGALGVAVISGTLALVNANHVAAAGSAQPYLGGFYAAFVAAAALALVGSLFAFTIRDLDAAASMRPSDPSAEGGALPMAH